MNDPAGRTRPDGGGGTEARRRMLERFWVMEVELRGRHIFLPDDVGVGRTATDGLLVGADPEEVAEEEVGSGALPLLLVSEELAEPAGAARMGSIVWCGPGTGMDS